MDCSDLSLLIDHVASAHPSSPLYAIGFSLGANFVSRHLMQRGADTPLLAALSVCNSFDCTSHSLNERIPTAMESIASENRHLQDMVDPTLRPCE
jgi:predicted alpha/beta-fold hydrolase